MIKKVLSRKREQLTEIEESVYTLYKEELNEIYSMILVENSTLFLNNLSKRAKISISKRFNDFSQNSITKIECLIQNQVYPLEYKMAYTAVTCIKKKQESLKPVKPFSGGYTSHCSSNTENLFHSCGRKFYGYKCKSDTVPPVTLIICIHCDTVYKSNLIRAYCCHCKEDYYTKLINEEECSENNGKSKQLAAFKKYHCKGFGNEKMKCLYCLKELYYIKETGLVGCSTCQVEFDAKSLTHKCSKCFTMFSSEAKAYNPMENVYLDMIAKDALVKKIKAKPERMNCCSDLDIKKAKFYHDPPHCNGEMFYGEMSKTKVVVCSKCQKVEFYSDFHWKCPKCSKASDIFPIQKSYEKKKEEKEQVSTDNYHTHRNSVGNIPLLRHSDMKKRPSIPLPLSKRNSNGQLIKNLQTEGNIPNYSDLKCNLAKRFSCFNVLNLEEKFKNNIDETHIHVKSSSLHSNSTSSSNQLNQYKEENDESSICKFNIDDYTVIKQIGEGSFGKIFLVESKCHQQYALKKIIASSEKELESLKHEYDVLLSLQKANSPSLIHIYGIQSNQLDPTTYIMYVLMELGTVDWEKEIETRSYKRQYYTEAELLKIVCSLAKTFAEIQRGKISHRDIKPQNILVCSNSQYKIADFGEAKEFQESNQRVELQTLRGTELYMSPVLFQALRSKTTSSNKYVKYNAYKSDVFSFGLCVLYAAALSYNALYDVRELTDMISIKVVLNRYLKKRYSDKMIDLMMMMLEVDEETRFDFIELEKELEKTYVVRQ